MIFSRPVKGSQNSVGNFVVWDYMIVIGMDDDDQTVHHSEQGVGPAPGEPPRDAGTP